MNMHFNAPFRFLSFVLCLMILLGPSYRVFAQDIQGVIIGDGVTTRSGPGVEYDKIGRLKAGDHVSIMEQQDKWLRIIDTEGREVWVFSRWVEQVDIEEEPEEIVPVPVQTREPEIAPIDTEAETTPADDADAVEQPPLIVQEEKGGFPWLWVGLGTAVVGAVAVVAASGGDDSADESTGTLVFDIEFP